MSLLDNWIASLVLPVCTTFCIMGSWSIKGTVVKQITSPPKKKIQSFNGEWACWSQYTRETRVGVHRAPGIVWSYLRLWGDSRSLFISTMERDFCLCSFDLVYFKTRQPQTKLDKFFTLPECCGSHQGASCSEPCCCCWRGCSPSQLCQDHSNVS